MTKILVFTTWASQLVWKLRNQNQCISRVLTRCEVQIPQRSERKKAMIDIWQNRHFSDFSGGDEDWAKKEKNKKIFWHPAPKTQPGPDGSNASGWYWRSVGRFAVIDVQLCSTTIAIFSCLALSYKNLNCSLFRIIDYCRPQRRPTISIWVQFFWIGHFESQHRFFCTTDLYNHGLTPFFIAQPPSPPLEPDSGKMCQFMSEAQWNSYWYTVFASFAKLNCLPK